MQIIKKSFIEERIIFSIIDSKLFFMPIIMLGNYLFIYLVGDFTSVAPDQWYINLNNYIRLN